MRTHPTLRCHDTTAARSLEPPITAAPGVVPCVRQGISLALILSSSPRRIACRLLDSGGGEGAEGHTWSPHDAGRVLQIWAFRFRQRR